MKMPPRAYEVKLKFFNLVFNDSQSSVNIVVTSHFPPMHTLHAPVTPPSSIMKTHQKRGTNDMWQTTTYAAKLPG